VVIHEFAHKLDELTGAPNGLPPLPAETSVINWAEVMNAALLHSAPWPTPIPTSTTMSC
jgi:Mlc titration factor MtfA (ptsG expression regulator)